MQLRAAPYLVSPSLALPQWPSRQKEQFLLLPNPELWVNLSQALLPPNAAHQLRLE
jgi:hypothetical protein